MPEQRLSDDGLDDVDGLAGLPTGTLTTARPENAEIYVAQLGKWLEVRSRYLNWVDGRLAQMVIATDITPRREAEELSAAQAERAHSASRLITMGEMASSVAHELNQPLTAINNYCSGMVTRIKDKKITDEDLLGALEKTSRQAQRAGQIIQRIRSFVKRSEPNRTLSDVPGMVAEAVELAEIEFRRRNVRLTYHIAARLPELRVDPILIEQVLVNLMKNAAESIDTAAATLGAAQRGAAGIAQDRGGPARGGVLGHRHRPGAGTGGHGAPVRGLLLHQGRRHGHRAEPVPQHRGIAPRPDAGAEPLQWSGGCRLLLLVLDSGHRQPANRCIQGFRGNCMSLIPKKGTVYVVDDDEAVRDSLQWLLEGKDYRVRCFDSAESFLSRYDPREVACLIVDIRMAGMTGLELQDRLIERRSPLPIVFITGHGDVPMAVNTMKKGAMDFIQKPFNEEALATLVERMLGHARSAFADHQQTASRDALISKLTGRESQVLERIVAGRLNKQIADDLGISIKTVEAHRANIMEKLNANTVADLLKIALGQTATKA
jgi:FixJ family two-component response regulator